MMKTAMRLMELAKLEQAKKITGPEQWELNQLRQKMFDHVHSMPMRVSDPFGLLNEDVE
jgi:uncharacterized protein YnzC (UPF0291/DUF896 family)